MPNVPGLIRLCFSRVDEAISVLYIQVRAVHTRVPNCILHHAPCGYPGAELPNKENNKVNDLGFVQDNNNSMALSA